jgi:serine/threonine protein kinase
MAQVGPYAILGGTNNNVANASLSMYYIPLDSVDESPAAPPLDGDLAPLSVLNIGLSLRDLTYCPDFDTLLMLADDNVLHTTTTPVLDSEPEDVGDLTQLEFTQRPNVLSVHCASLPTLPRATAGFFAAVVGSTGADKALTFIDASGSVLLPNVPFPSGLEEVSKIVTTPVGSPSSNGTVTTGTIRLAVLDSESHAALESTVEWSQSEADGSVSMASTSAWRTVIISSSVVDIAFANDGRHGTSLICVGSVGGLFYLHVRSYAGAHLPGPLESGVEYELNDLIVATDMWSMQLLDVDGDLDDDIVVYMDRTTVLVTNEQEQAPPCAGDVSVLHTGLIESGSVSSHIDLTDDGIPDLVTLGWNGISALPMDASGVVPVNVTPAETTIVSFEQGSYPFVYIWTATGLIEVESSVVRRMWLANDGTGPIAFTGIMEGEYVADWSSLRAGTIPSIETVLTYSTSCDCFRVMPPTSTTPPLLDSVSKLNSFSFTIPGDNFPRVCQHCDTDLTGDGRPDIIYTRLGALRMRETLWNEETGLMTGVGEEVLIDPTETNRFTKLWGIKGDGGDNEDLIFYLDDDDESIARLWSYDEQRPIDIWSLGDRMAAVVMVDVNLDGLEDLVYVLGMGKVYYTLRTGRPLPEKQFGASFYLGTVGLGSLGYSSIDVVREYPSEQVRSVVVGTETSVYSVPIVGECSIALPTPAPTPSPTPAPTPGPSTTPADDATKTTTTAVDATIAPQTTTMDVGGVTTTNVGGNGEDALSDNRGDSSSDGEGSGVSTLVLIVVIAVAVSLLIVVGLLVRRGKAEAEEADDGHMYTAGTINVSRRPVSTTMTALTSDIEMGTLQLEGMEGLSARFLIESSDLQTTKILGEGSFGTVAQGVWQGHVQVAVKEVQASAGAEARKQIVSEALRMQSLRAHPNIITFYGICLDPFAIVLAYAEHGSLDVPLYTGGEAKRRDFSEEVLLRFSREILLGLVHLHRERVIHRDMAARNVLLDINDRCLVTDFGMARSAIVRDGGVEGAKIEETQTTATRLGPVRWMAPEQMESQAVATSTDVWSYGVVLYEIWARQMPWKGLSNLQVGAAIMRDKAHVPIPETAPDIIKRVMTAALQHDSIARPSSAGLLSLLTGEEVAEIPNHGRKKRRSRDPSRGTSRSNSKPASENNLLDGFQVPVPPAGDEDRYDGAGALGDDTPDEDHYFVPAAKPNKRTPGPGYDVPPVASTGMQRVRSSKRKKKE